MSESKTAARKALNFAGGEKEPPTSKLPRINKNPPAFLDSLNSDCLLTILSYLPAEDLNSVAICSRRYRRARAHESLDQTRSGTITVSQDSDLPRLADKIIEHNWEQVFQGNRTHLIIEGIGRHWGRFARLPRPNVVLSGVTSLVLSPSPHLINPELPRLDHRLVKLFPNLAQVNFVSKRASWRSYRLTVRVASRPPNIRKLFWNGCETLMKLSGQEFRHVPNLADLHIDGCHFLLSHTEKELFSDSNTTSQENNDYAFYHCRRLERLSIKNVTIRTRPVSQDIIIKMVRRHASLKWLRSDLSAENIVMLQAKRPDITFVTE